jgi:hypothetical protein
MNSIEKIQNEEFHSCHNTSLYSSSSPSMALQESTKGRNTQRRRRFHNRPLNLPEIYFQMPNIPIEIYSTFFGDASKDAEQHLIDLKGTCYDFNLTEDNVTCRLFLQTLREDALEWYSSLLCNSITSWGVLEDSFVEKFIPKVDSYVFYDVLNVVSHPSSPMWKKDNEMPNFEEESNQRVDEIFKSSYVVEDKDKISKLQEENFNLLYTPYEDISSSKFENEIEEPPPNTQEDFSLVIDDETLQVNLQQEELME